MRKYQQLLLLITSVVSLSLLFVYRHEYNRLHYVLEVFNFFGQPCNVSDLEFTDATPLHHDWGSQPAWQEITDNIYIYSAFWEDGAAKALALHTTRASFMIKSCYLWFDDLENPISGKLKSFHEETDEGDGTRKFTHQCISKADKGTPYAVSFGTTKLKQPSSFMKKHYLTSIRHDSKKEFDVTVCVVPGLYSKSSFLEFLSYHKLIGIDNYLFYEQVPHRLEKIISNLSNKLALKVNFFAWNYPLQYSSRGNLSRLIVEQDCLLRTAHVSTSIIVLDLNEYVVPSNPHSSFNKKITSLPPKKLLLPVQKFCLTNFNKRKPLVLQNIRAFYDDQRSTRILHIIGNEEISRIHNENKPSNKHGFASVHKYVKCLVEPKRMYEDNSILSYSTDLLRSTLVQLHLYNNI